MKRFLPTLGIGLSFIVASTINIYPVNFVLAQYRPMILPMVLIFWAIYQPKKIGVASAFFVGLVSDLLLDTHLGYQAFCAVFMVVGIQFLMSYTKRPTFVSAWIVAFAALLLYRSLLWLLQSFGHSGFDLTGTGALMVSLFSFPLLWVVLIWLMPKFNMSIG